MAVRAAVIETYSGQCQYCMTQGGCHVDQILPIAKGGTDDIENLTLSCRLCNARKADYELTPLFGAIAHLHARENAPEIRARLAAEAALVARHRTRPHLAPEPPRLTFPPGLPRGVRRLPWTADSAAGCGRHSSGEGWRAWAYTDMFSSVSYHRTEAAARSWCTAIVEQFHGWEALGRLWASGKALVEFMESGGDLDAAAADHKRELLSGRVRTFIDEVPWRSRRHADKLRYEHQSPSRPAWPVSAGEDGGR